jgi:hypothetical protein
MDESRQMARSRTPLWTRKLLILKPAAATRHAVRKEVLLESTPAVTLPWARRSRWKAVGGRYVWWLVSSPATQLTCLPIVRRIYVCRIGLEYILGPSRAYLAGDRALSVFAFSGCHAESCCSEWMNTSLSGSWRKARLRLTKRGNASEMTLASRVHGKRSRQRS